MAETETRTEAGSTDELHVELEPNGLATNYAVEDDESEEQEAAEESTEATPGETEAANEELLTAEEAGVDENSPEYQALRKKFIAAYQRKLEKERDKLKATAKAEPEPAQETAPAAAGDPIDDVFNVPLDEFKAEVSFRDGSDLMDYKDEISEAVNSAVKQAIKYTLETVKRNDQRFREQMVQQERVGKARSVIVEYAKAIEDHPDFEAKAGELSAFAEKTKQLAIEDPELWIEMAERKTGLTRDWRGESEAAATQRADSNRRLAAKPRAAVPRPTTGRTPLAPVVTGRMKAEDAFEAAWRASRARG